MRVGRRLPHLIETLNVMEAAGVSIRSVTEANDTAIARRAESSAKRQPPKRSWPGLHGSRGAGHRSGMPETVEQRPMYSAEPTSVAVL